MSAAANIKAIAKRELGGYFSSPVAYVFIVIFLLLTGFFTFTAGNFFERGEADLEAFFMWHPWLYLFLVPCVGMRLWAEERRVGTIELLLTKPITTWQAVTGKFLASWIFLGLALALTFPVLITVNYLGLPDNGIIVAAYLGSFLMAGAYLAISCMTSAMTRNQVVSFILSVVICLFLVLCGFPPVTSLLTRMDRPWLVDLVSSLSMMTHFQSFANGVVDSRDVIFFLLIIGFCLFANAVIIRGHRASSAGRFARARNFEAALYSTAGVAAMFVVMLAAYIVISEYKLRWDVTANQAHTLSSGTKNILRKLDSRVTIRFYCTREGNAMPPALRTYARHIEDLLHEYDREARGKLLIEDFDPTPDSDAEESAKLNGMEGRSPGTFGSDKIYLGMVVSLLDEKFVLPWLAPDRERSLEYDISRAILRVIGERPIIGIMTALPIYGQQPDPLMRPGMAREEEWAFVTELKKDFTLQGVPMNASNIDNQIQVLLVAHPANVSDTTQYAIDQFLLRGGKLLAFLDPHAYFDQSRARSSNYSLMGDNAGKSSLDKLLPSWGLNFDEDKVVADTSFASRNLQTGDTMPTLLLINRQGIDENDVVTSQIDNLVFPFAGAFTGKPTPGLSETVLVKSSPDAQLVDTMIATASSQKILQNFQPANQVYPLVVHLTGKFKTAFPEGPPEGGKPQNTASLQEPARAGEVVLVADTDMLNDHICVRVQNVMGHRLARPANGNLNLVQSVLDEFTGDDDLISSRSRASMGHPFVRIKDMETRAGKVWEEKVHLLETKQREAEQNIKQLQVRPEDGQKQDLILSANQEKELEAYQQTLVQVGRDLKQVRKNLRKDTDALEFWIKVINIGAVPTLVALSGIGLAFVKSRRRAAR